MNSLFLFSSHSDFLLKIPFIRFFGSKIRVKYLLFTDKKYDDGRKVHRAHHWSSAWWIASRIESCCCWSGTLPSDRSRIFRRGWSWNEVELLSSACTACTNTAAADTGTGIRRAADTGITGEVELLERGDQWPWNSFGNVVWHRHLGHLSPFENTGVRR